MVISLVLILYNIKYYNLLGREIWVGRDGKDGRNWVKATFKVGPFPLTVFDFALTSPIDTNDSALLYCLIFSLKFVDNTLWSFFNCRSVIRYCSFTLHRNDKRTLHTNW